MSRYSSCIRIERSSASKIPCGGTCPPLSTRHFSEFIPGFNLISAILSVVGGVLVDSSHCPFVFFKKIMYGGSDGSTDFHIKRSSN